MKYAIVFATNTGNTKLLADTVKSNFNDEDIIYFGSPNDKSLDADIIYLGFWTNMGTCNDEIKEYIKTLTNQKIFLFGSAGFLDDNYKLKIINNIKNLLPSECELIGSFMCQGKMRDSVKERYLDAIQKGIKVDLNKMLLKNFEEALKHPSEEDLKELIQEINK